jgi:hypothetical protein
MQFHIDLIDTDPCVWRRVAVDPRLTMAQLHLVVQHAIGWTNSHMHEFQTKAGERITTPMPDLFGDEREVTDERRVMVSEMFPKPKTKLAYIYDMGDYWVHAVTFEKLVEPPPLPPLAKATAAIFMAGERACPPEDCGGIPGYFDCLKLVAKAKPRNDDERDHLEWLGDWRPDALDPAEQQRMLTKIRVKKSKA